MESGAGVGMTIKEFVEVEGRGPCSDGTVCMVTVVMLVTDIYTCGKDALS